MSIFTDKQVETLCDAIREALDNHARILADCVGGLDSGHTNITLVDALVDVSNSLKHSETTVVHKKDGGNTWPH